ncbi:MAG TPA: family 16 glycoside hydrolase [Propionibacteriaceae bacterium]
MEITYDLTTLPEGAELRSVVATPATRDGRQVLRVSLTDEVTLHGAPGVDYVDQPTFVILPVPFENGTLEVDVCSGLNALAPDYARGFAGLAYRISDAREWFEAVYVRPLNGRSLNPPTPRERRTIQYFAYPDWPFDRLREERPDGPYESGADIVPGAWLTLKVHVDGDRLTAWIDGVEVLSVAPSLVPASRGHIGLFVDIGTEAYFSNLRITPA